MYEELFEKAKTGDTEALRLLRQRIDPGLTVFVVRKGELDVDDSLAAFDYHRRYGSPPVEWGDDDAPTCAIDQAFIEKVRKDPIKLMPLTGGVWKKLWEHTDGHKWIAAFFWGQQAGHLNQGAMQLKEMAQAIIDGKPGLMARVAEKMEQMAATQRAMDMVFSVAGVKVQEKPQVPRQPAPQLPGQIGQSAAHRVGLTDILRVYIAPSGKLYHDYAIRLCSLLRNLSVSELNGLAQQVGAEYRGGMESAIRGIVSYVNRRGQATHLISLVVASRPDLDWFDRNDIDPASLRERLLEFAVDELRNLCVQLADEYGGSYYDFIGYDRLAGRDINAKVESLILWHRVDKHFFFQRLVYHVSLRGEVLTFGGHPVLQST